MSDTSSIKPKKKLTDKEELFCQHFVRCLDKTKAARKAGYSEQSCGFIGYENYKKPYIFDRIKQLFKENIDEETLEDTLASHLKNITAFNINDLLGDDGELDPEKLKAVEIPGLIRGYATKKRYDQETGRLLESSSSIKVVDQLKAIDQLCKIKKILNEAVNINNFILTNATEQDAKV